MLIWEYVKLFFTLLFAPAERTNPAAQLLSIACDLQLLNNGWEIKEQPGTIYFQRGEHRLDAFSIVNQLRSGALTPRRLARNVPGVGHRFANSRPPASPFSLRRF